MPRLPATEPEPEPEPEPATGPAANAKANESRTTRVTDSRSRLAVSQGQDRRENSAVHRNQRSHGTGATAIQTATVLGLERQYEHTYVPPVPLAVVNSDTDADERLLFLDTRPSSPTLSDSDAYAPSAATASVYTTHTHAEHLGIGIGSVSRFGNGNGFASGPVYSSTTTDSMLLSPATVVGAAMLREWDAVGGPDAGATGPPAFAHTRAFPPPVTSVHTGTRAQAKTQNVPSLPPVGQPSLRQLALMREMPEYRSPTYSIYGMYSGSGTAAGVGAEGGTGGKMKTQMQMQMQAHVVGTPESAYGGLAALGVGVGVGVGPSSGVGVGNMGVVPGTGLFGRIL
jgi:hypothetical protein